MKKLFWVVALALLATGALAQVFGPAPLFYPGGSPSSGRSVSAPRITITVPTDPSVIVLTTATVSGTTTYVPITVTWRIGAGGETACTLGSETFTCAVTGISVLGNNTITVTATNASGTSFDTVVLDYAPPPTIVITSHGSPEAASTTPETVSGTTFATTSVTWASECVVGPTACSTGAGTFSCSITQTQDCADFQTVSVVATGPGGTGDDATFLLFPAFSNPMGATGTTTPNDLPTTLTHNGVVLDLALSCNATSAGGLTCTPDTVAEAGAGSSPVTSASTPFHAVDSTERSVTFGAVQKRLAPAASTAFDLTTEDFIFVVLAGPMADSAILIDKSIASVAGWRVHQNGTGNVQLGLRTASTSTTINTGGTSSSTGPGLFVFVVDRDEASTNGALGYANGAVGTGVDVSARAGSLSNAVIGAIGATAGAASSVSTIYAMRLYKCPSTNKQCFAGGAGGATAAGVLARDLTAIAFGASPLLAAGIDAPTTMTRSTTGYTDILEAGVRTLYNIGPNAPRIACRDNAGATFCGFLSEPATTNLWTQSQTFENVAYTNLNITLGAEATAAPDLTTTADSITPTVTNDYHRSTNALMTVTNTTTYTASVWLKANGYNWAALMCTNLDTANYATADLSSATCAQLGSRPFGGTEAATVLRESYGNGWCRLSLTGVTSSTTSGCSVYVGNNAVWTYAGDTTSGIFAWGAEMEAFPTATSYQATTTAGVTRGADDLRFDGASHYTGSPTTLAVGTLCPNFDNANSNPFFATVGTSTTNYAGLLTNSSDRPRSFGFPLGSTTWDITGASGDVFDGAAHTLRASMVTNDIEAWYDAVSFGTDTVAALPSSSSAFVYIGTAGGAVSGLSACLINDLRIWSRDVTPTEAP